MVFKDNKTSAKLATLAWYPDSTDTASINLTKKMIITLHSHKGTIPLQMVQFASRKKKHIEWSQQDETKRKIHIKHNSDIT